MDVTQAANLQVASLAEQALKIALVSEQPDLLRVREELGEEADIANERAIAMRFAEKVQRDGCPPSYGTFYASYCEAMQAGEIQLPPAIPAADPMLFQSAEELQAFSELPRQKMEQELNKLRPAQSRNIADQLLTGEGSYRWNVTHHEDSGDTEALAAMRKQIMGE